MTLQLEHLSVLTGASTIWFNKPIRFDVTRRTTGFYGEWSYRYQLGPVASHH